MACYNLVPGFRTESGDVVMVERGSIRSNLWLPCGQCVGCRLERSRQWAIRVVHEAQMHEENSFLTLTYSDECLPLGGSLVYEHFQVFIRSLRKRLKKKLRYYMCGEYGEEKKRPHYHVALFGEAFLADRKYKRRSSGYPVYGSAFLNSVWGFGECEIGILGPQSAGYIARYVMKKVNGGLAASHYRWPDFRTGEVCDHVPEFTRMSLKPGIGATWFGKFSSDVFPHDRVVLRGVVGKPPRFYDGLLKDIDRVLYDSIKDERECSAALRLLENSPERLAVKEVVAKARVKLLRRTL